MKGICLREARPPGARVCRARGGDDWARILSQPTHGAARRDVKLLRWSVCVKSCSQSLVCALVLGAEAPTLGASPCVQAGALPCTWGGCEFSKNATGVLARNGTCSARSEEYLYLDIWGITGLSPCVFDHVGSCLFIERYRRRHLKKPSTRKPLGVWALYLDLDRNQLVSLSAGVFGPLTQLKYLGLR
jgi:hypothetical protein